MSNNTKIVVLRSKELIYTVILLIVVVLIVIVTASIFIFDKNNNATTIDDKNSSNTTISETTESKATESEDTESENDETESSVEVAGIYVPGVYSSVVQLGASNLELQITVDHSHINSINFTNIDESVATMYPLIEPTLNQLSSEILSEQSITDIESSEDNRYTSLLLMQAIEETLDKAKISENADSPEVNTHSVNMS